jgi:hypothetical protein
MSVGQRPMYSFHARNDPSPNGAVCDSIISTIFDIAHFIVAYIYYISGRWPLKYVPYAFNFIGLKPYARTGRPVGTRRIANLSMLDPYQPILLFFSNMGFYQTGLPIWPFPLKIHKPFERLTRLGFEIL